MLYHHSAYVIGIVSDEIKVGIKSARNGNYPVRCAGHVLLLNWNSQTTAILRQIAAAEASGRGGAAAWYDHQRVVILADKSKAEMDAVVHEVLRWAAQGERYPWNIHCDVYMHIGVI